MITIEKYLYKCLDLIINQDYEYYWCSSSNNSKLLIINMLRMMKYLKLLFKKIFFISATENSEISVAICGLILLSDNLSILIKKIIKK